MEDRVLREQSKSGISGKLSLIDYLMPSSPSVTVNAPVFISGKRYLHIEPRRGHLKRFKNMGKCL
jgi:hypothetical protein